VWIKLLLVNLETWRKAHQRSGNKSPEKNGR